MLIFLKFLDAILAILVIALVVLQSGKSAGMGGSIAGGAEVFLGGKRKGLDEVMSKATIWVGLVFAIVTLIIGNYMQIR